MDNSQWMKNNVRMTPPRFVSHLRHMGGLLPDQPGAHACFYYCRTAMQMLKAVRDGADYQGEIDHQNMLNNLARSVALMYRLDSPDDFLAFLDYVKAEALRLELEWNVAIEKPGANRFVKKDNS